MIFSIYISMGAIVGFMSEKFLYTSNNAAVFGVFFIVLGVIGSLVHAVIADKYQKHKI